MGRPYVHGDGDGVYTKTRRCCYLVSTNRTTTVDVIEENGDKLLALPATNNNYVFLHVGQVYRVTRNITAILEDMVHNLKTSKIFHWAFSRKRPVFRVVVICLFFTK